MLDINYDSLGNIYVQTDYCNWVRPKDTDTLFPITELKDMNKSFTYKVYQDKDGWKNISNPKTEFGANGYVTQYFEKMLFVRNDSIYSLNEMISDDSINTETFKYIGNDKWIFGNRTQNSDYSIKYHGFYIFDAKAMEVKHFSTKETGGTQASAFIHHYNNSFFYFCYPNIAISKFDENGYTHFEVSDSIRKSNPNFLNTNFQEVIDNKIWIRGYDNSYYSFDMETYELKQEISFDEDYYIYQLEKGNLDNYKDVRYNIYKTKQDVNLHYVVYKTVVGQSSFYIHNYYFNTEAKPEPVKIQLKDTTEYMLDGILSITDDGKIWFKVKYYPGGNRDQIYQVGVISFDPLAPDTDIIEAQPTVITGKPAPNPAKTFTTIEFYIHPHTKAKAEFKIYNYSGVLIKELDNDFDYNSQTAIARKRIDVESLKTGIYYLVIDNKTEKRAVGFAVE